MYTDLFEGENEYSAYRPARVTKNIDSLLEKIESEKTILEELMDHTLLPIIMLTGKKADIFQEETESNNNNVSNDEEDELYLPYYPSCSYIIIEND